MRNVNITDGHVRHLANGTNIGAIRIVLVLGSEQNGVTGLAEASPEVLREVAVNQHSYRILEFDVILDDERIAVCSSDKRRAPLHPLPWLPEVVAEDLDIGWSLGGRSAAEQDLLTRGFQEVILDQVRTVLSIAESGIHSVRIGTASCARDAMEVVEIGIDDRNVGSPFHRETGAGFILRVAMQPGAVDDDVIGGALERDQSRGALDAVGTGDFQADEAVEVGAIGELERPIAGRGHLHLRQNILGLEQLKAGRPCNELTPA